MAAARPDATGTAIRSGSSSHVIRADVAGKDYNFDKVPELMAIGAIKVQRDAGAGDSFLNLFDRLPATMQPLAVR